MAETTASLPLIRGAELLCPRCETYHNLLWYERWGEIEDHAHETNPIYRCPKRKNGCGWIFSPAERAVVGSIYGGKPPRILDMAA